MESKKKHMKIVTQKKKFLRANPDPFLSVLQWGTNYVAKELNTIPPPPVLLPKDFKAFTKVKIQNFDYNKNLPKNFKFKHYCPMVFRSLRERFQVKDDDLVSSMCDETPIPLGKSEGRSDARFYVSYDKKFIIKTMSTDDVIQFHSFLESYHQFIVEKDGSTLLPQYLSMFRITLDKTEHYVIILRNIFSARLPIHQKFDLKGSEKNRRITEKELRKFQLPTFKDLDFKEKKGYLHIGEDAKSKLMEKLQHDVDFLHRHNLMDYSLLIGVHDCKLADQGDRGLEPLDLCAITSLQDDSFEMLNDETDQAEEKQQAPGGLLSSSSPPSGNELDLGLPPSPRGLDDRCSSPDLPNNDFSPEREEGSEIPLDVVDETEVGVGGLDMAESIPSLAELDLTEDVYAIPSDPAIEGTREVYYVGLVDILTYWGTRRKMASTAKTVRYGTQAVQSTVNPDEYSKRFLTFIDSVLQ